MSQDLTDVQVKPDSAGNNKRAPAGKGTTKGKSKGKKDVTAALQEQRASPRFPCVDGHTTNEQKKNCSICQLQLKQPDRFDSKKINDNTLFLQDPTKPEQTTAFIEFIQYLLPPSPDLEGCEVMFPDSVFFFNQKAVFIASTDKEGKLKSNNNQRYLGNFQTMRQQLSQVIKDRKQENKSDWYKDSALVRYNNRDEVKVLRDNDLIKEFGQRATDPYWLEVEVVQTCIKAKTGCGEPITCKFMAKIDEQNPEQEIRYDYYKDMPDDNDLLSVGNDAAYVEKQCLKMCYYIQKVCGHEVLQMKAEFFKDDNGQIWFFYARNIHARKSKGSNATSSSDAKKQAKKLQQSKEAVRKQMITELEQYESQQKNQRSGAVQQMLGMMNNYYSTLKNEVGIQDQTGLDDEDYDLDNILKTLKPNTTSTNFREFLKREDNCTKTQAWRQISRQIHTNDKRKLRKLQEDEDGPFNPGNMKVSALYDAFQNNYRQTGKPMIDEPGQLKLLDRIVQSQQDMRPEDAGTRGPNGDNMKHSYDPKDNAQVKAELIRRNLLSRKDLMQLYRPPLKKSQLPQNNPFIARNLVTRDISSAIVRISSVGPGGKVNNPLIPGGFTPNQQSNLRNSNITLNLVNQHERQAYKTNGGLFGGKKSDSQSQQNYSNGQTRSTKDLSVNQRKYSSNRMLSSHTGQRPTTTGTQVRKMAQGHGSIFNYATNNQGSIQTNHDSLVQIGKLPASQMNVVGVPGARGNPNYQQMVMMGKSASNFPQTYQNSNSLNAVGIGFNSSAYTNSQTAMTGQTLHQSKGTIMRGVTGQKNGQQMGLPQPKSLIQMRQLQGNQSMGIQGGASSVKQ